VKTEAFLVAFGALVATAAIMPACIVVARRWDVLDRPGALKSQPEAVPYLGGVAVFAGVVVGACVARPVVLVPLAIALAVGVSDDRFDLPASARLVAQLGVGAVIAAIQPVHLPGLIGVPLVMAATVVLINGFNLLDGLDMLAAGVGAAAVIGFALVLAGPGRLVAASMAGALVGFLLYNRPPARIYLGDGGSYLIGASMTVLLAYAWGVGVSTTTGVLVLAVVAIPVAEVTCAIVRRRRGGRSLLAGDRAHPYDLIVAAGWSRTAASATYIAAEIVVVALVAVVGPVSVGVAIGIDLAVGVALFGGAALVGGLSDPAGTPA
jgi:UDP-GlcNAc:undecaprenyl-phosphate/decaprenyl-phosphate GlcNAc-1-phosphate transferase